MAFLPLSALAVLGCIAAAALFAWLVTSLAYGRKVALLEARCAKLDKRASAYLERHDSVVRQLTKVQVQLSEQKALASTVARHPEAVPDPPVKEMTDPFIVSRRSRPASFEDTQIL